MLDMLTDRCSLLCLQLNLALLYPSAAPLLQLSVCLDIASHWLHMHTWAGLSQWGGGVNGGGGARRNWGQPLAALPQEGGVWGGGGVGGLGGQPLSAHAHVGGA